MVQLPSEVYSAIASYVTKRDLITLSRTSKELQRAAEPRFYDCVYAKDAQNALICCHAILARDAFRAPYVRKFILYEDPRFVLPRRGLNNLPPQFWLSVQQVLIKVINLDYLVLHDSQLAHSWILDHQDIKFQLREANLRLAWDANLVAFLTSQKRLQSLTTTGDSVADGPLYPLPVAALRKLEVLSGSVFVVAEALGCPLTRVQIFVDEDTAPILPTVVSDLAKIVGTLRKLHLVGLPEQHCLEILEIIAAAVFAPDLRYLGILTIPSRMYDWPVIYRCLMNMPALEMIEFDISRWEPSPPEPIQRTILLDFHIYSPRLQQAVFWAGQQKYLWFIRDGLWDCVRQGPRIPAQDTIWRT